MKIKTSLLFLAFFGLFINISTSQQVLFINEILAGNQTDIQDVFFQNEDWLEIYYQAGSSPAVFNLAGYFLSDDPNNLGKWEIPNTNGALTTVVAGQHLLFWIDKDPQQGEDHVDFKFSLDGETVFLVEPDTLTIVDSVSFPASVSDISYGRECDGCEDWVFFNNTTPEDPNGELVQPAELLFINEVLTQNTSNIQDLNDENEQWVEIYNPNPFMVNLAGYSFTTNESDPPFYTLPNTNPVQTAIPGGSFRVFWFDGEVEEGQNHIGFSLSETGGNIQLIGPDGASEVDSYDYPVVPLNQSYGRQSDGSVSSIFFNIPTPRVTNELVIIEPELLYINELMASNQTDTLDNYLELEDWIEIYNPNAFPVNLAGYFISDNPANPMKYQIVTDNPDSTTIAPFDWLLLWADEDADQGAHHLSFRLSNLGEQVTLFSPDGFTIADQIEWGIETADVSFGRLEDGSPSWIHFLETTPDASNNGAMIGVSENIIDSEGVLVYPNPIKSSQNVYLSETATFRIYDSYGRLIQDWMKGSKIDITSFNSGMYLIQFSDFQIKKLLIER